VTARFNSGGEYWCKDLIAGLEYQISDPRLNTSYTAATVIDVKAP